MASRQRIAKNIVRYQIINPKTDRSAIMAWCEVISKIVNVPVRMLKNSPSVSKSNVTITKQAILLPPKRRVLPESITL